MNDPSIPSADDAAAEQDYLRRRAEILQLNKTALFDALSAASLTKVIVHFDGYGDSGQIESIDAYAADESVNLPAGDLEIAELFWGKPEIARIKSSFHEAIEALVYEVLDQTHPGWEDCEGAYGDFIFDVTARSIHLDHKERFIDTISYEHTF